MRLKKTPHLGASLRCRRSVTLAICGVEADRAIGDVETNRFGNWDRSSRETNDVRAAGREIIFYQANRLANGRCYRTNKTIKQIPVVLSYMGNGTIYLEALHRRPGCTPPGTALGSFGFSFKMQFTDN
jgi:hypothetical protein